MLNRIHDRGGYIGLPNTQETYSNSALEILVKENSTDISDKGYTLTPFNSATTSSSQIKYGNTSMYFPEFGSCYQLVNTPALDLSAGTFTVEFWVYMTVITSPTPLLGFQVNAASSYGTLRFQAETTGWRVLTASGTTTWTNTTIAGSTPSINTWYHVAITHDGSTIRVFIDGTLIHSYTDSSLVYFNYPSYIGSSFPEATGTAPPRYIDDFRVVNGQCLYTSNFTPAERFYSDTSVLDSSTTYTPELGSTSDYGDGVVGSTEESLIINSSFTDESNYAHTVTPYNTISISTEQAKFGTSSIKKVDQYDYMTVVEENGEFDFGTGDFTVEAWIINNNSAAIACGGGPTNGAWLFGTYGATADSLGWGRSFVAWDLSSATLTWNNNQWYHVAASRSGGVLKLFRDGVQVASASNTTSYTLPNNVLVVGARQDVSGTTSIGNGFTGYLDGFKITKGVGLYTSNFTPPTSPFEVAVPSVAPTLQSSGIWSLESVYEYLNVGFSFDPVEIRYAATFDRNYDRLFIVDLTNASNIYVSQTLSGVTYLDNTQGGDTSVINSLLYTTARNSNDLTSWDTSNLSSVSLKSNLVLGSSQIGLSLNETNDYWAMAAYTTDAIYIGSTEIGRAHV